MNTLLNMCTNVYNFHLSLPSVLFSYIVFSILRQRDAITCFSKVDSCHMCLFDTLSLGVTLVVILISFDLSYFVNINWTTENNT